MNRRAFLKKMNWGLAGIIGMLGFGSCSKIGTEEYGTPHADYTVKGTVVNKSNGKPIEGIRVGYYNPEPVIVPAYGTIPAPYTPKVHVLTNAKGEFKLTDRFDAGGLQQSENKPVMSVIVQDIDGEKNGLFQPGLLQVDFSNAVHDGNSKGWYEGEYTLHVNVGLTEIKNQ